MAFISRESSPKEKYLSSNISSWWQWGKRTTHRNKAELLLSGDSFRFPLRRRIENLSSNLTIRMFWTSSFLFRRAGIILYPGKRTALIEILQVISVRELGFRCWRKFQTCSPTRKLMEFYWVKLHKSSVKLSVGKGNGTRATKLISWCRGWTSGCEIRKNFSPDHMKCQRFLEV